MGSPTHVAVRWSELASVKSTLLGTAVPRRAQQVRGSKLGCGPHEQIHARLEARREAHTLV